MKKNQVIDLGLTGYDELFMNDQERATEGRRNSADRAYTL